MEKLIQYVLIVIVLISAFSCEDDYPQESDVRIIKDFPVYYFENRQIATEDLRTILTKAITINSREELSTLFGLFSFDIPQEMADIDFTTYTFVFISYVTRNPEVKIKHSLLKSVKERGALPFYIYRAIEIKQTEINTENPSNAFMYYSGTIINKMDNTDNIILYPY